MKSRWHFALVCSAAIMAAACSTTAQNSRSGVSPAATGHDAVEDDYILTRIAEPELPKGRCGMILWTLEQDRPEPVFKYIADGEGTLALNGAPVSLSLVDARGARAFGIAEAQSFADDAGAFDITVAIGLGLGFDGGTYLERGLITIENAEGWRSVTPVAGIAGCRSK